MGGDERLHGVDNGEGKKLNEQGKYFPMLGGGVSLKDGGRRRARRKK